MSKTFPTTKKLKAIHKKRLNKKIKDYRQFFQKTGDSEFDWAYFIRLMQYKLQRMAKFFREDGISSDSEKVAKEMEEVAALLGRVCDFDYENDKFKQIDKKYGRLVLEIEDGGKVSVHRTRETIKNSEKIKKLQSKAWMSAEQERQKDLDKALGIISKRLFCWWD